MPPAQFKSGLQRVLDTEYRAAEAVLEFFREYMESAAVEWSTRWDIGRANEFWCVQNATDALIQLMALDANRAFVAA
jgi:hypothetical protein